jgi:uncharacterized protein
LDRRYREPAALATIRRDRARAYAARRRRELSAGDTERAVSEDDVEVVRAAFGAWNRGDRGAWMKFWDEEAEFYPLRAQLEGRPYRGAEGLRRFVAEVNEDWDEIRFELDQIRDVGGQVVATGRARARARASGLDLDVPLGLVGTVRSGKIVYGRFFSDPMDALEAVGVGD